MSLENRMPGSPSDWLRYAISDLKLACVARPTEVLLEALCFHAQQAAEKALKSVLVANDIPFPKTHNLRTLLDLLPEDITPPPEVQDAASLTDYAVLSVIQEILSLSLKRNTKRQSVRPNPLFAGPKD